MKTLIDRDELYKALAQWDWQDLYLPVHFKELVDELPAQRSYEDGVRKGYEDAVRHYAKMALKQWIPVSERLPVIENNSAKKVIVTTSWGLVGQAYYCVDHWEINDISYKLTSIVAWMPLPEPYKEGYNDRLN